MMNIDYFNSDNHVYEQCKKIENLTNRRINIQKIKEMNAMLFNRYYRRKPINMSDSVFLDKLSIKSVYDVCEKVIEEEKRKGRPVKIQPSIVNKPFQHPTPGVMQQQNKQQKVINTNGETVDMQYQRLPQLQTNNTRVQATNYQSVLKESGVNIERPNEEEVMSLLKEKSSDWLNPRKSRSEPKEQQMPMQQDNQMQSQSMSQQPSQMQPQMSQNQQSNQNIMQQQLQSQQTQHQMQQSQPNELSAPNDNEFNNQSFNDDQFGGLLSGISEEEKAKFNNNNPIKAIQYNAQV